MEAFHYLNRSGARNKKTLRLDVTRDDIRLGKRLDPCKCAVARACCRAIGVPMSHEFVNLGRHDVTFGVWYESRIVAKLPRRARSFIKRFDERKPVKPTTFVIKNPLYEAKAK